jgi:hypothetical protein
MTAARRIVAAQLNLQGTSATLLAVPPGRWKLAFGQTAGGMFARPGIELAFTDATGRNWLRSPGGALTSIRQSPVQYYRLPEPVDWVQATPLSR